MDYFSPLSKGYWLDCLLRTEQYWIRQYVCMLRKEEYYTNYKKNKLLKYYFFRKKNILGARLGFFIDAGCFGAGAVVTKSELIPGVVVVGVPARIIKKG